MNPKKYQQKFDMSLVSLDNFAFSTEPTSFDRSFLFKKEKPLRIPTFSQLVDIIDWAHNHRGEEPAQYILTAMRDHGLSSNTVMLYAPETIHVQDNPDRDNFELVINKKESKKTDYGFKTGELTPKELANHQIVAALSNSSQAQKLAEITKQSNYNPILESYSEAQENKKIIPVIYGHPESRLIILANSKARNLPEERLTFLVTNKN